MIGWLVRYKFLLLLLALRASRFFVVQTFRKAFLLFVDTSKSTRRTEKHDDRSIFCTRAEDLNLRFMEEELGSIVYFFVLLVKTCEGKFFLPVV